MRRTPFVIGASALAACIALVAKYFLMRTPPLDVAKPHVRMDTIRLGVSVKQTN